MEVQLEEHSLLLIEVFFLDQALEWQVGGNFVLYNKSPGPSDCAILASNSCIVKLHQGRQAAPLSSTFFKLVVGFISREGFKTIAIFIHHCHFFLLHLSLKTSAWGSSTLLLLLNL